MKLEHGKRYNTIGFGVGRAVRNPERNGDDVTAMFFDTLHDTPIYFYDEDEGRSNISFITTRYDVVSEYTEQE